MIPRTDDVPLPVILIDAFAENSVTLIGSMKKQVGGELDIIIQIVKPNQCSRGA